jgi:hypothetical protein
MKPYNSLRVLIAGLIVAFSGCAGLLGIEELSPGTDVPDGGATVDALPMGDTTRPTVESHDPSADSVVAPGSVISVVFDEPVAAASLTSQSFAVIDSANQPMEGTFSVSDGTVTFHPKWPLMLLERYSVRLTTAITDLAGNALSQDYSFEFQVREGAWEELQLIETNNAGSANEPQVVMDGYGNVIVVWHQSGPPIGVWATRYDVSTGWEAARVLNDLDGGDARFPRIVMDAEGNATIVWQQSNGTLGEIWATRYDASSGWGAPARIETDVTRNATNPELAMDGAGNVFAVWLQSNGTINGVRAARFDVVDGWSPPASIDAVGTESASGARVAADAGGNAMAVWREGNTLHANRFVAGADWTVAERMLSTLDATEFHLAMNPTGNATLIWTRATDNRVVSLRYDIALGWDELERVLVMGDADAKGPRVAMDPAGNAISVWVDDFAGRTRMWAARYDVGSEAWSTPLQLGDGALGNASPGIAVDARGNGMAVCGFTDAGDADVVLAVRYTSAGGFGEDLRIDSIARDSHVAIGPQGQAAAAWLRVIDSEEGLRRDVYAALFR